MLVDREAPHESPALKTFDDKRYLGAVIGSIEYRENYVT